MATIHLTADLKKFERPIRDFVEDAERWYLATPHLRISFKGDPDRGIWISGKQSIDLVIFYRQLQSFIEKLIHGEPVV
jgi:hypothetical protein